MRYEEAISYLQSHLENWIYERKFPGSRLFLEDDWTLQMGSDRN